MVLMSDTFTFSDLGRVHWGSTFKLAAGRGFFTGLVVVIVMLVFAGGQTPPASLFGFPIIWGILAPLFGIAAWAFFSLLGFLPFTGILLNISSLMMCLGDPIVYMINRSFPALFDIADLRFFNFLPMIFITHPD
jgi:hypothetical protein